MARLVVLVAAAAGTLDSAEFIARRPGLFMTKPGRALGSSALLAGSTTLLVRSLAERDRASGFTRAVAAGVFAGNAATLAAHLKHGIATPRVFVGPLASALVLAVVAHRR